MKPTLARGSCAWGLGIYEASKARAIMSRIFVPKNIQGTNASKHGMAYFESRRVGNMWNFISALLCFSHQVSQAAETRSCACKDHSLSRSQAFKHKDSLGGAKVDSGLEIVCTKWSRSCSGVQPTI